MLALGMNREHCVCGTHLTLCLTAFWLGAAITLIVKCILFLVDVLGGNTDHENEV
jgi:Flp pilus assembly protein protease CpaA